MVGIAKVEEHQRRLPQIHRTPGQVWGGLTLITVAGS
jgi:hypothetical protein